MTIRSLTTRWQRQILPHPHRKTSRLQNVTIPKLRFRLRYLLLSCLGLTILYYLICDLPSRSAYGFTSHQQWLDRAFTASSTVQVFMPIDSKRVNKNPDFCRTLWSAIVNGYRVTLYNWDIDVEDEFDTHKPKITGLSSILLSNRMLQSLGIFPQDLIFLVDSVDVILQLSPSVLVSRYSRLSNGQLGRPIAAGSFNCWPNEHDSPACIDVPPSDMPEDMFHSERTVLRPSEAKLPIHANSGLVLGTVSEMRTLFEKVHTTLRSENYTWQYDQGAFNIHLHQGDLIVDNTLSIFWCAEHVTSSLSLHVPSVDKLQAWGKYIYPFQINAEDLPDSRPVGKDKRTLNIPVALHFNGIGAKPGFNQIWEEMWPDLDKIDGDVRRWQDEMVNIIRDFGIETRSVKDICGWQLGL